MHDMTTHARSGKLCNTSHGKPIIWNGHVCEGSNVVAPVGFEFCLWTLCEQEVPANEAHEGDWEDAKCMKCLRHGKD